MACVLASWPSQGEPHPIQPMQGRSQIAPLTIVYGSQPAVAGPITPLELTTIVRSWDAPRQEPPALRGTAGWNVPVIVPAQVPFTRVTISWPVDIAFPQRVVSSAAWNVPAIVPAAIGNVVVPNTVQRLGALFKKTVLYSSSRFPQEPSLAVRKFLDELKVERKKALTTERRNLASLKVEQKKIAQAPAESRPVLQMQFPDLDIRIQTQSQVVRDARKLYEEAERETEQSRVDALAEFALEQWNRDEAVRKVEAERQQAEDDDEMMQVLLMVHAL